MRSTAADSEFRYLQQLLYDLWGINRMHSTAADSEFRYLQQLIFLCLYQ